MTRHGRRIHAQGTNRSARAVGRASRCPRARPRGTRRSSRSRRPSTTRSRTASASIPDDSPRPSRRPERQARGPARQRRPHRVARCRVGDQGQVGSCAAWATDYSAMGYWMNKQGIAGGAARPDVHLLPGHRRPERRHDGSTLDYHARSPRRSGVDALADYAAGQLQLPHAADAPPRRRTRRSGRSPAPTYLPCSPSATSTVTQDSIKTALADGKPVVVAIPVYPSFYASVGQRRALQHRFRRPAAATTPSPRSATTPPACGSRTSGARAGATAAGRRSRGRS